MIPAFAYLLLIFFSVKSIWAKTSNNEITKKPSSKVTIHKRTEYFIDVEGPKKEVWVSCSDFPENDKSYMGFHILDGSHSYMFFYRRPLRIVQCHKEKKEYLKMIKSSNAVRIVGISPDEELGPEPIDRSIPKRFTNTKKITSSVFSRLQVKNRCKAFFVEDCDLPKNYWANTIPK